MRIRFCIDDYYTGTGTLGHYNSACEVHTLIDPVFETGSKEEYVLSYGEDMYVNDFEITAYLTGEKK